MDAEKPAQTPAEFLQHVWGRNLLNDWGPPRYYVLGDGATHPIIEVEDIVEVVNWCSLHPELEQVGRDEIPWRPFEPVVVSTVFLNTTLKRERDGRPALFETLILGGPLDGVSVRSCSWVEARALHESAVRMVQRLLAEQAASAP